MKAVNAAELHQRLADLAVADAPEFTVDQIVGLRRVLRPYLVPAVGTSAIRTPATRRNAA